MKTIRILMLAMTKVLTLVMLKNWKTKTWTGNMLIHQQNTQIQERLLM